jgi:hypothetical protein
LRVFAFSNSARLFLHFCCCPQTKHDAALSASAVGHGSSASAAATTTSSASLLGQKPKAAPAAEAGASDARVAGIASPLHADAGLGLDAASGAGDALGGLHWSTW